MKNSLGVVFSLLLAGCVQRSLHIQSFPSGADLFVDGVFMGTTPAQVNFVWYGQREILLEKEGCASIKVMESIDPPWWQIFPFDFFTDVLLPIPLNDIHRRNYTLAPEHPAKEAFYEMKLKADEARKKTREE
jgi:hypothetical protein